MSIKKNVQMPVGIHPDSLFQFAGIDCAHLTVDESASFIASCPVHITAIDCDSATTVSPETLREQGEKCVFGLFSELEAQVKLLKYDIGNHISANEAAVIFEKFKKLPTTIPSLFWQDQCVYIMPKRRDSDSYITKYYPVVRPYKIGSCDGFPITTDTPDEIDLRERHGPGNDRWILREDKKKTGKWSVRYKAFTSDGYLTGEVLSSFTDPNIVVHSKRFRETMANQGWHYVPERGFWANASEKEIKILRQVSNDLDGEIEAVKSQIFNLEEQLELLKKVREKSL